ncbi:LppU/SCO3897 family protein [Streptomyces sp. bgisy022]|uniref:LppU/SCO3897 family protein n=1 Tax=Streptomyces sp. bgisy022 TaxID=3413769 RepID=UPI003D72B5B7
MTTPPPQGNPFAQGQPPQGQAPQPPQGGFPQPAGQPGFPQGGQPGFPPPGAPVPPPPSGGRFNKKLLRVVAVIAIAIVIGVVKWQWNKSDAETTSVGSCMQNEGTQFKPDLKSVDCSSGDAEYKVVEKFDGTSDSDKCKTVPDAPIAYYQTGGGHEVVLCLKDIK